jgi:Uma2 family endonuclease
MSSVIGTSSPLGPPPYPIRPFSVAEYEEMTRVGILTEDDAVELLEGWIVPKMPKYPPHDNAIDLINYLLTRILPLGWFVRIQNSITTTDSVPEPDLAVVRGKPGDYGHSHPTSAAVGLIIEVAESTVKRDRIKASLYARGGIPQYWIVNLDDKQVEVYSSPPAGGEYQPAKIYRGDDAISVVIEGRTIGAIIAREVLG